jgi:hypothetical protein
LYEITTLTDEQFAEFLKKAKEANSKTIFKNETPFFSHEMVLAAKQGKVAKSPLVRGDRRADPSRRRHGRGKCTSGDQTRCTSNQRDQGKDGGFVQPRP